MSETDILKSLEGVKDALDGRISEKFTEIDSVISKNQKAIDDLLVASKYKSTGRQPGNFADQFSAQIEHEFNKQGDIFNAFQNQKDAKLSFNVKAGTMTLSNVTGDVVATYAPNQALVPNQKVNFRDLIPSVTSPTGLYVHYRETGSTGSIDELTEGSAKSQIDYSFTEVKTVDGYTAGFSRFSKQLMKNLPWLQTTLVRQLLRDFYKKENFLFWRNVANNASGYTTTAETDDIKEIIDILTGRADRDFSNSFILCQNAQVGILLKLLYTNGYYAGSGSVVGTPDGNVRISGTPIIGASFAAPGKVMIIDTDFIERVQTEDLRVEFSYEDSDNFQKNLVTARVECFENLNLLRPDAHSYFTI